MILLFIKSNYKVRNSFDDLEFLFYISLASFHFFHLFCLPNLYSVLVLKILRNILRWKMCAWGRSVLNTETMTPFRFLLSLQTRIHIKRFSLCGFTQNGEKVNSFCQTNVWSVSLWASKISRENMDEVSNLLSVSLLQDALPIFKVMGIHV